MQLKIFYSLDIWFNSETKMLKSSVQRQGSNLFFQLSVMSHFSRFPEISLRETETNVDLWKHSMAAIIIRLHSIIIIAGIARWSPMDNPSSKGTVQT